MRFPTLMRTALAMAAIAAGGACPARSAQAHAVIVDSTPAAGAEIAPGDDTVTLRFNSRIDHRKLSLVPPAGAEQTLAVTSGTAANVIAANLPKLAPGRYRLHWVVMAVDGHLTQGFIPFSVKTP